MGNRIFQQSFAASLRCFCSRSVRRVSSFFKLNSLLIQFIITVDADHGESPAVVRNEVVFIGIVALLLDKSLELREIGLHLNNRAQS